MIATRVIVTPRFGWPFGPAVKNPPMPALPPALL